MNAVASEDRLRLETVSDSGELQAIWVTRRLADRFVPALAKHVEQQVQPSVSKPIMLSINQDQVRKERASNPAPPVPLQREITPWLCRTMHLKKREQGLIWTMTDDATIDAHMILTGNTVRALLDVFLNNFRKLEWSEEAFPEWVRDSIAAAPVEKNKLN
jgi:hypothetical protein